MEAIMKLFVCDHCKYEFESSEEEIVQCPDCGKLEVRQATPVEKEKYTKRKNSDDDIW